MNDRLTIRVEGRDEFISVASFLDIMQNTLVILDGVTKNLSAPELDLVEWRIVAANMINPLVVTIRGHVDGARSLMPEAVVHACIRGLRQLEESNETLPPYFTIPMLDAAARIGHTLANDGISTVTYVPDDIPAITPSPRFFAHVSELTPRGHIDIGSIEGTLEMLSEHGKTAFVLYDRVTGRRVDCAIAAEDIPCAKAAVGRRVDVHGSITFNREGLPEAVLVSVNGIDVYPEQSELPQFADLEGMQITRGIDPVEYVRRFRDDDR